jgi:hypothetical protein
MKLQRSIWYALLLIFSCSTGIAQELKSPDGNLTMKFSLLQDGTPSYTLQYKGKEVIRPSKLGLELKDDKRSLLNGFSLLGTTSGNMDETWSPVWGEESQIRNKYNELAVNLEQSETSRRLIVSLISSLRKGFVM